MSTSKAFARAITNVGIRDLTGGIAVRFEHAPTLRSSSYPRK
jgi:hypothetical protein